MAKADVQENTDVCAKHKSPRRQPIGLHEARHSYVSFMHDAGFSLERIGDYVGHSSVYMTDRYRHLLDGHEKEAADLLDAYLTKGAGAQRGAHLATVPAGGPSLSQNRPV